MQEAISIDNVNVLYGTMPLVLLLRRIDGGAGVWRTADNKFTRDTLPPCC